ncbi:MAG: hypothetical protein QOE92_542 [Chloroflexota bacterium]|nr:hypothetical protein [Chloroflexota bacterium]
MSTVEIRPVEASPANLERLAALVVEAVAAGGSVTWMHPLAPETAKAYWTDALASAQRGERVVLGAWDEGVLAATVTLLLAMPQNQPHRAEILRLMTQPAHRGRGLATALMREAERIAVARGRTLLVLDTASDGGAAGLYEGLGYTLAGEIPGFALKPHGGLTGTLVYWKSIGAAAPDG